MENGFDTCGKVIRVDKVGLFETLYSFKTAVHLPFGERRVGVIEDSVPSLEPGDVLGRFAPELLRFVDATTVDGVIQTTISSYIIPPRTFVYAHVNIKGDVF